MKTKKGKGIRLYSNITAVLTILILFGILGHMPFTYVKNSKETITYNNVLKRAYLSNKNFGDTPITKIAVLGSHDALSYGINYFSMPNSSEDTLSNNVFIQLLGKGAIVRYSRAQQDDIYTQLNSGVRYIDARITYIDGEYYTSHGLVSCVLESCVMQILRFLNENPGEFIYFHIVHFYPENYSIYSLVEYMKDIKYNNKSLFDYVNYDTKALKSQNQLTYNMMTQNGTKAGILFLSESKYFDLDTINSHWHNITNSDKLCRAVEKYYKTLGDCDCLRVNQAQTTPNANDIVGTIAGWSLLNMAKKHNANMLTHPNFAKWLDKMPIYMCDYTTSNYKDFNKRVNEIIYEHNINLK